MSKETHLDYYFFESFKDFITKQEKKNLRQATQV